jgi:hypothetical protein
MLSIEFDPIDSEIMNQTAPPGQKARLDPERCTSVCNTIDINCFYSLDKEGMKYASVHHIITVSMGYVPARAREVTGSHGKQHQPDLTTLG